MSQWNELIEKQDWRGRIPFILRRTIKGKIWKRVKFREVDIYEHNFMDCQFLNCAFEHCRIGNNVTYDNCLWQNCSFSGQYSSLGSPAVYRNCRFVETKFKNGLWSNLVFDNCLFSGEFANVYWEGRWADSGKPNLQFSKCDMQAATFKNVTIKNGLTLDSILLPKTGLRLFDNNNEAFTNALLKGVEAAQDDARISLKVMADFAEGQHPVLYDDTHLDHHPGIRGTDSREAFESIAKAFELRR
ncbi:pentapeptide repeat-containing protein [Phnomibacter ginsenosidimutans]|uniref:Pentapeptide repeat-containing protein n=1 Tax=Phnomibacter ginsenosidimutans TaxID=2676868 RepID=A0A6I6G9M4_9BACT|nr:pentapeptide repeat-containing protein [Phnomibacter ginsenosidimutans]QGW29506.1 hypothetical protein GLV81_16565 [Phnomibacter ginsenosidimutans]